MDRPLESFASPGQGSRLTRQESRFVLSPTPFDQPEEAGRAEAAARQRKQMQLSSSPRTLLHRLRGAIEEGKADASVFGAAMQRCGQGLWWDTLHTVRDLQKSSGVSMLPLLFNIYVTALARCARGTEDGAAVVQARQQVLVDLAWQAWQEAGPALDADTFTAGLGATWKLCTVAGEPVALGWAQELWRWSRTEPFEVGPVARSNYILLLERYGLTSCADELLTGSDDETWSPNVVLLGGLVNAAAESRDQHRVEELWHRFTNEFSVQPNLIAYGGRAKAHLLCGRPAAAADAIDEMLRAGIKPNAVLSELLIQAALVLYHSSLAAEDLDRLGFALREGEPLMSQANSNIQQKMQDMREVARRIQSCPAEVGLHDVLVGWNLRRSAMADWPDHRSGTCYLKNG